ncbi:hypothetical protein KY290_002451 [Solanum tuberosum]|uniref:FMR1-interacting protein 1 conserved domain-containing protein n=2 Tax=Solanum tuberosum TaxID=4113 RepID=M1CMQ1_SOLTU|nr:PREDICTED: uncharacterized protein LOC102599911 isoform X1 [Solanum tuberosum]KAH0726647.1 hypothetical protein KY284_002512 [Solanum tuberosum]KAH0768174.1 hypothetical protein KY285_004045 [Solanum tuberosum]KAH0782853.1 hypothetical protein KY290_002451 [Solanum tuberosum]
MLPGRNSRPQHPSKLQANGTAPSPPLQVMGNPGSFMPNHMQIQSQMAIPNNNPNTQFFPGQLLAYQMNQMNNANSQQKGQFLGQNIVNPPQFLNQNVGFGVMPNPMQNMNQFLQMQMAMQMASYAQALSGSVPMYPNQVPQGMGIQNSNTAMNNAHLGHANASGNLSKQMANGSQQLQGQSPVMNSFGVVQQPQTQNFNAHASANPQVSQGMGPQSSNFGMNAHLGLVNANVAAQQSKNGLSKQMPNATQQLLGQLPLMNSFDFVQQPQTQNFNPPASANTQVCQGIGPQIPNFSMNAHLGLLNANGAVQQMPNVNQQLLGQLPMMNQFGFVQQPQTQNFNAPASTNTQANPGCVVGINPSKGNQQNSYNSNFSRNQKHGAKMSKFGKGKFSTHNKNLEKGHHRNREKKNIDINSVKPEMEKKRPLLVTYSAQEIQQWRDERRKNYPSKGNIEKQLTGKMVESEDNSCAAKLRRQQLKEILAKQAELGFEVAEIPSSYLSDTEKQVDGMEQKRPLSRKERFQKRFNKKEKFNRNDRFSKKRRFGNSDSSNTCDQKGFPAGKQDVNRESVTQVTKSARESTLLEKLLSSDIRRDKRRLLQVFRFMTMNSFFKDQPGKPLRFPRVLLKETGKEIEAAEEISDVIDTNIEKSSSDNDNDEEDNIAEFTEAVSSELQENSSSESEEPEEEQISG